MRILVLNYEFPPVGGGGGRVSYDIARGLVERGHQVMVLTSRTAGLPAHEEIEGMAVRRISCLRRSPDRCSVPEMGAFILAAIPAAFMVARRFKPDVVHAHFAVPTGVVAYVLRKLTGLPYLLTAHLGDVPGGVPDQTDRLFRLLNPLIKPVWRNAGAATAVSSYVASLAEKSYGRQVRVIHNGVTLPVIRPDVAVGAPVRLVFAGRFNPQKNLRFLIAVLAGVQDCDWTLEMIGDGPEFAAIEAMVHRLGLADRIRLAGWRDDSEIDGYLSAADILVIPSLSEGFPVAAVRALACGLAIYGSDIGGLTDIVVDGINGVVVEADNRASGIARMRHLLENPDRLAAMRRASRLQAEKFELGKIVMQYEDALNNVTKCV